MLLLTGTAVWACDVPVFSYAMQFWEADPYQAHVFYRGELSPAAQSLIAYMESAATEKDRPANLEVYTENLDDITSGALLELYETYLGDVNPGLIVRYPAATRIATPVYAGVLSRDAATTLLDSPARRELIRRLLRGDMAVWLLLESGNRTEDNRAAQMIEREIERMAQVLQLPAEDLWVWSEDIDSKSGVRFSMMRVPRDAPEEEMLVSMLLGSEPDLADRDATPMAFPVYGRGLALYALVGAGINAWNIADACEFVIGPCSCQVKAANPGTDLLLTIDWAQFVRTDPHAGLPHAAGLADFFERGEEAAARLAALDDADTSAGTSSPPQSPAERLASPGRIWWLVIVAVPILGLLLRYIIRLAAGSKEC